MLSLAPIEGENRQNYEETEGPVSGLKIRSEGSVLVEGKRRELFQVRGDRTRRILTLPSLRRLQEERDISEESASSYGD